MQAKQRAALRRMADLNAFERRVYSQNGEDGIMAELFSRIPNNRYFVEIGVEDGQQCNAACSLAIMDGRAYWSKPMTTASGDWPKTIPRITTSAS